MSPYTHDDDDGHQALSLFTHTRTPQTHKRTFPKSHQYVHMANVLINLYACTWKVVSQNTSGPVPIAFLTLVQTVNVMAVKIWAPTRYFAWVLMTVTVRYFCSKFHQVLLVPSGYTWHCQCDAYQHEIVLEHYTEIGGTAYEKCFRCDPEQCNLLTTYKRRESLVL